MGFGGINNQREEERAIKAMINQLMMSIAMGNLDAISTALIMIARQGKNTLIKAAFSMTMALQSQEQQQEVITDQMGQLAGTETNYASSLQTLNSDMGRLSNNRQMLVNLLRDVKSMSDELDNMAKSWQDVELQQGRRQMVFTA